MALFGADAASMPERELRGLNTALVDLVSGTSLPLRFPAAAAVLGAGAFRLMLRPRPLCCLCAPCGATLLATT
eukprot:380263-Lingulodinium_polyedra.AAC.1